MNRKQLYQLLDRYVRDECTEEERIFLEGWFSKRSPKISHFDQMGRLEQDDYMRAIYDHWKNGLLKKSSSKRPVNRKYVAVCVVAASFVLIWIGIGYMSTSHEVDVIHAPPKSGYLNTVTLTLPNGNKIPLLKDSTIMSNEQGNVFYNGSKKRPSDVLKEYRANGLGKVVQENSFYKISTPSKTCYRVILPDGSLVLLNASSELAYPAIFSESERKVVVHGEAFFQVVKDERRPFVVVSQRQLLSVLGTSFNIVSFSTDQNDVTTLLNGAVKVSRAEDGNKYGTSGGVDLLPGQSCYADSRGLRVEPADTTAISAWRKNDFVFNQTDLGKVLTEISRWYGVDIKFDTIIKNQKISGIISRANALEDLLGWLEEVSPVTCSLDGNTVTIKAG